MSKKIIYYILGVIAVLFIVGILIFLLFRSSSGQGSPVANFFGVGGNVSTTGIVGGDTSNQVPAGALAAAKVFKISAGPVASATFFQTFAPTTTIVRYAMQDNGHILDLSIDTPGAIARPASNTTIPGVVSAVWGKSGTSTVIQYVAAGTVKTLYIALASTTAGVTTPPARIQFLPNNIVSLALSPDGASVVYLLKTTTGTDGYTANADGTNSKKLFSLPLSQTLVSWPSQNTLLTQTKGSSDVPGISLSIDVKSGVVTPLLYTPGLSVTANNVFSKIVYQKNTNADSTTYSHDTTTGKDLSLANNPLPEKCVWSTVSVNNLFCALPLEGIAANYVDLWHQGLVQSPDSILMFDTNTGSGSVITVSGDGGVSAPIDQIGVSNDGKYLYFITRGSHALWGVRL